MTHSSENDVPLYEWDIEVRRLDHYGQRVEARTPAKVLASTGAEVTTKVRAMFNATYDDFRKFWSHTWALNSVQEVQRLIPPAEQPWEPPDWQNDPSVDPARRTP